MGGPIAFTSTALPNRVSQTRPENFKCPASAVICKRLVKCYRACLIFCFLLGHVSTPIAVHADFVDNSRQNASIAIGINLKWNWRANAPYANQTQRQPSTQHSSRLPAIKPQSPHGYMKPQRREESIEPADSYRLPSDPAIQAPEIWLI
eukprot:sb/3473602/